MNLTIPEGFYGFSNQIKLNQIHMAEKDAFDYLDEIIQLCSDKNRVLYYISFDKYKRVRHAANLQSIRDGNTVFFNYKQRRFIRQPLSNIL